MQKILLTQLLLCLLSAPAFAEAGGETPAATFDKIFQASQDDDIVTIYQNSTPPAQTRLVFGKILSLLYQRNALAASRDMKSSVKPAEFDLLLKKHKINLADIEKNAGNVKSEAEVKKQVETIVAKIPVKVAFLAEAAKLEARLQEEEIKLNLAEEDLPKLQDVTIADDRAVGFLVIPKKEGGDERMPTYFRRIEKRWYAANENFVDEPIGEVPQEKITNTPYQKKFTFKPATVQEIVLPNGKVVAFWCLVQPGVAEQQTASGLSLAWGEKPFQISGANSYVKKGEVLTSLTSMTSRYQLNVENCEIKCTVDLAAKGELPVTIYVQKVEK